MIFVSYLHKSLPGVWKSSYESFVSVMSEANIGQIAFLRHGQTSPAPEGGIVLVVVPSYWWCGCHIGGGVILVLVVVSSLYWWWCHCRIGGGVIVVLVVVLSLYWWWCHHCIGGGIVIVLVVVSSLHLLCWCCCIGGVIGRGLDVLNLPFSYKNGWKREHK